MKKALFISAIILIVMEEGRGQRQTVNNDIITVDVTKSYATKKELILQDLMDVEYIQLETDETEHCFYWGIGTVVWLLVRQSKIESRWYTCN